MQLLLKRCKSEIVWKNATVKYLLRGLKSFRQPQMCLESFSCAEYLSARELLSTFYQAPNPGIPLQRKLEDAHAALEMMYNGCYRSAAKNWFALIEHEHKRCADILEGYWEVKKEYKNGGQRSEKIYMIVNDKFPN